MAYNGGYPGGQRPPPQRQYPPQQQQYDQYDDGYGYNQGHAQQNGYGGGNGGYDQGYGGGYDDQNYGHQRQAPPRDQYGPPNGGSRRGGGGGGGGGGIGTGRSPEMGRGGFQNGGMGRGRPDPGTKQSAPEMSDAFGGSPFPTFPGQNRKTDFDQEQMILNKMGDMNMGGGGGGKRGGRPGATPRGGMYGPNGGDDWGRPAPRGPPARGPPGPRGGYGGPQGYPEPRRGPPAGPGRGRGGYGGGYGGDDYGAPQRTMTMPSNVEMGVPNFGPPQRSEGGFASPMGRGMVPPRPSTSQGMRPSDQGMYGGSGRLPPQNGGYQDDYGYDPPNAGFQQPQRPLSYDNIYDDYYQDNGDDQGYGQQQQASRQPGPRYDSAPQANDGYPQPMPDSATIPGRTPQVTRPQTAGNVHQSQSVVFDEMPPMPAQKHSYEQQRPGGGIGAANGNLPQQPPPPQGALPGLPSHPAPVRAGHMPNSVINNMANKPAPVRNYAGGTPAGAGAAVQPPPVQNAAPRQKQPAEPPVTVDELERLRSMVKVNPQDQATALRLAKRLLEASDVLVSDLPDPKSRARARERYLTDCQKILKKLAAAQNADAMFLLADCVGKGTFGDNPDDKEAFTLYQSAAKLGHAAAAYRTAVCCEIGNEDGGGTRKDPLKAIQWYKRAATLGDIPAMYKLGMILLKGLLGQPRNPGEAVTWLKRASQSADAENPHSLHELGLLYENPPGNLTTLFRDEPYAFSLFKQAADLGYKFSQFRLGSCYEYGLLGCPIDPRLSIMWYSRAATQEEHQSELALSGWYLTGSPGVLGQSDTEAYLWARKSAAAGLAKAEYAMGYFTEMGIGIQASIEDAKRWYWRAAAQNFPQARERLEEIKRSGKNGPRQRERISRSRIGAQNEGECAMM